MPILCINCKHFRPADKPTEEERNEYSKCDVSPKDDPMSLVDGRKQDFYYCSSARLPATDCCGPEAKLFEPK